MRNERIRTIAEIGLAIALATALTAIFTLLVPVKMPFGGTLSLNMLPIVLIALRRGPIAGVICGALVGFADLMFDPYVLSIPQILLDYPIAYSLVGLAGLFARGTSVDRQPGRPKKLILTTIAGTALGTLGRFAAALLSGVVFFAQYAPEAQNVWVYSAIYNLSYLLPNALIVALCATFAAPIVFRVTQGSASKPALSPGVGHRNRPLSD